jgi:hypothetical protein
MGIRNVPYSMVKATASIVLIAVFAVAMIVATVCGCVQDAFSQSPGNQQATAEDYSTMHDYFDRNSSRPKYTPKFGLDPIGQAIVRDRTAHLDQERRIRLLERQVAQLQRIVFQDPTIQPPVYRDTVPTPIPDPVPDFPFGSSGIQEHEDKLVIPAGD